MTLTKQLLEDGRLKPKWDVFENPNYSLGLQKVITAVPPQRQLTWRQLHTHTLVRVLLNCSSKWTQEKKSSVSSWSYVGASLAEAVIRQIRVFTLRVDGGIPRQPGGENTEPRLNMSPDRKCFLCWARHSLLSRNMLKVFSSNRLLTSSSAGRLLLHAVNVTSETVFSWEEL